MNVGVAHSESNPNSSWLSSRGSWVAYLISILGLHLTIRSLPFIQSTALIWTITNSLHNIITYVILHLVKGAPWENTDQGKSRRLTHWEQIDAGHQFTDTRKFFAIVPILLFLATNYLTHYAWGHFAVNSTTLLMVLLPKLPQFHKVRIFDINKY